MASMGGNGPKWRRSSGSFLEGVRAIVALIFIVGFLMCGFLMCGLEDDYVTVEEKASMTSLMGWILGVTSVAFVIHVVLNREDW